MNIGNGFLIQEANKQIIVTNYHVIRNAKKFVVKNYSEKTIEIKQTVTVEEKDLAFLLPISIVDNVTPFVLNLKLKILDEILTIGYPPVPTTKFSHPLFHLGEINSFVENYWGNQLFIFSAKTNPGNSGSPIIDKMGTIVGIVSEQLEEQEWYKKGKIPYYAGIPSAEINNNLKKVFDTKKN